MTGSSTGDKHCMGKKNKTEFGCKQIQPMIPGYLDETLDMDSARIFTEHVKKCAVCRDELEISYLLKFGIEKVERGETINLTEDLDSMISDTEETMMRLTQFHTAVKLIEGTAVFMLCVCILLLYI